MNGIKKKARSTVGAAKQAVGANFAGQVPVHKYTTGSFELATLFLEVLHETF